MVTNNKVLTVSYGTFSCTLEGFDDSFDTMKSIAEYFRDLAADDRYFGAEPPTPDADMLARIAEREIARRVEAHEEQGTIHLRAADAAAAAPAVAAPVVADTPEAEPVPAAPVAQADEAATTDLTIAKETPSEATPEVEPEIEPEFEPEVEAVSVAPEVLEPEAVEPIAEAPQPAPVSEDSVAAKLQRIRAVVSQNTAEPAEQTYTEDQHAEAAAEPADADLAAALSEAVEEVEETAEVETVSETPVVDQSAETPMEEASAPEVEAPEPVAEKVAEVAAAAEPEQAQSATVEEEAEAVETEVVEATPAALEDERDVVEIDVDAESVAETEDDFSAILAAVKGAEAAEVEVTPADLQDETAEEHIIEPSLQDTIAAAMAEAQEDLEDAPVLEPVLEPGLEAASEAADQEDAAPEAIAADTAPFVEDTPEVAEIDAPEQLAQTDMPEIETAEELPGEAASDAADAASNEPVAAEPVAPVRPVRPVRVMKMKRKDFEAAVAAEQAPAPQVEDIVATPAPAAIETEATSLSAEEEADLLRELAQVEAEFSEEDAAEPLEEGDVRSIFAEEADVSRLMDKTASEMDNPEGAHRRNAIAHLRRAVEATRAETEAGGALSEAPKDNAYRADLDTVVRPGRPQAAAGTAAEPRPAPLKLVAAQRVDIAPQPEAVAPVRPVRPRRIRPAAVQGVAAKSAEFDSFTEFAEEMGAEALPDLLEAAASYLAHVEGREQFSRPQLMRKARQVEDMEFSREDGLRSFGQLLRDGKIEKLEGGRFTVSEQIGFKPDQRAAG